jgi:hypothetical protein
LLKKLTAGELNPASPWGKGNAEDDLGVAHLMVISRKARAMHLGSVLAAAPRISRLSSKAW